MKKSEKEHLKEDPFQLFIENTMENLRLHRKHIFTGIIALVVIAVVVIAVFYFRNASVQKENELYYEALKVQKDTTLTLDAKIEKLTQMKSSSGISASLQLSLAALYFEKGQNDKAKEALEKYKGSKFRLIDDKKMLLEAEILASTGKNKEAVEQLNKMFNDPKCEVGKDYILLKMARIQLLDNATETALANLKKLTEEFPRSMFSYEAQTLLSELENN